MGWCNIPPGAGFDFSARGVWVIASVGWVVGLDFGRLQFSWVGFLLWLRVCVFGYRH